MGESEGPSNVDLVGRFLRGQNLEQLGRIDDAVTEYEAAVAAGFDSTGPYDRLIALYGARAAHKEVVRVTEAALARVRTADDKRRWYRQMGEAARRAAGDVPRAGPRRPP